MCCITDIIESTSLKSGPWSHWSHPSKLEFDHLSHVSLDPSTILSLGAWIRQFFPSLVKLVIVDGCKGLWYTQKILETNETAIMVNVETGELKNVKLKIIRNQWGYNQWIGLLVKIYTGNPWFLPSNWSGFPVKIFPSSNSMIQLTIFPWIYSEFSHEKLWFSIVMLNYQYFWTFQSAR